MFEALFNWFGRRNARRQAISQLPPDLEPGDLCSIRDERGFGVAKVLAVDPVGVHVRVWKERFHSRPTRIDMAALTLGTVHDEEGFGFGHLPLSKSAFGAWQPERFGHESVAQDELDGYREWQEAGGGYW